MPTPIKVNRPPQPFGIHQPKRVIAVLTATLFLNGCCMFGYRTDNRLEWRAQDPSSNSRSPYATLNACQIQAGKTCAKAQLEECRAFVLAPTEVPIYHPNSGRRVTSDVAIKQHIDQCTELLERSPLPEQMSCQNTDRLVEQCMSEWGFVQTKQAHLSCAPMKLF